MKTKQIILALLLSAASAFAQEGPNLLTNPGFEDDPPGVRNPRGWDVSNLLPDPASSVLQTPGHSVACSFFINIQQQWNSDVLVSQAVSVLEPGVYQVRVWYRYGGDAALALLSVVSSYSTAHLDLNPRTDEGTWRQARAQFEIAYPDTFRLGFELKANGRDTYLEIDDVEFVRTGPPYPNPTPTPTAGTRSLTVKTKHLPGDQVPIKAPRKLNGLVFDRWVGDTGALENFISPNTSVTIPSTLDVQVEATYKQP